MFILLVQFVGFSLSFYPSGKVAFTVKGMKGDLKAIAEKLKKSKYDEVGNAWHPFPAVTRS